MALNDITINKGQSGLGRPLEGSDYISGLLFYTASLPSGFTSSNRTKAVFSLAQAVSLGIVNTGVDETKSACKIVIAGTPAIGDTLTITYTGIDGAVNVLSAHALLSGEQTSATTAAAAWVVGINNNTINTGFTATSSTGTITLTTKSGEGVFPNTGTPYAVTVTGGSTAALTQPTGAGGTVLGVASDINILYYHVSEFFRMQPKGKLWVGVYATADVGTFASITLMQNIASGEILQMGIYQKSTAFATSQITAIQAVCAALETVNKPLVTILGAELSATSDITTLANNLHSFSSANVSVTIAQDGAAVGSKLYKATGKSITNVGQVLGSIALAKVSESIAWFGKFKASATELDTLAFCNGQLYTAIPDNAITNLDNLGFMFLRKISDLAGSFHNRPYTCVSLTNDYAFVYSNRTFYKARKNVRATVLPALGSPIKVNSDGTLAPDSINYFKSLANQGIDNLLRNEELSNYQVIIDPTQNVLSTGLLTITVRLLPLGVADFITINLGFTLNLN